jgi:predicted O-methyltransferase YrrM
LRRRRGRENAISGNRQASWSFAEAYGADGAAGAGDDRNAANDALLWARQRARDAGLRPVSPGTGAALRLLAATAGAKAVAEIGTGTGVSGIHLLQGMRPDGVLTTVDPEPERQQFARQAFRAAGFAGNRARIIVGRALDVLPRLADGGYDMVFCDGDRLESLDYLAQALRLLRAGGLVCFEGVFADGDTVDSAAARPGEAPLHDVVQLRELLRSVKESTELLPSLLPVGDGLLCAVKR